MPNMLKILNYIGYSALLATFVLSLVAIPNHNVLAATKEESRIELINSILSEISVLLDLVKAREDFYENRAILEQVDHDGRSDDFFLRVGEDSPVAVYGSKPVSLIVETDGGVRQIVVTSSCDKSDSTVLMFSNVNCVEQTWINEFEMESGVKTFTIPVSFTTKNTEDAINLSVYACRFDGCVYETNLAVPYKEQIAFADQVEIYDRYEWEYEWKDNIYHVQEVLLSFPYKDIKKVKLRVRCDINGLYIRTTEDDRATCNNRREYTNPDYRDPETDELGNAYNLLIESVTKDSIIENSGAVEMEFVFIDKRNRVAATLYHRPVQEEVIDEDELASE